MDELAVDAGGAGEGGDTPVKPAPPPARLEIAGVILMGLTAVLTAWAGFQSVKWGGVQSASYSRAAAQRTDSVRESNQVNNQVSVDVATFIAWVEAVAEDDAAQAEFIQDRFSDRLAPAVDAWRSTDPLQDPDAPPTPFDMPEYVVAAQAEVDALADGAEASVEEATDAGERVDEYVMTTVMFALVLFFVALSAKSGGRAGVILLELASVAFLIGVVRIVLLPIEL